jgi:hypothetical protein
MPKPVLKMPSQSWCPATELGALAALIKVLMTAKLNLKASSRLVALATWLVRPTPVPGNEIDLPPLPKLRVSLGVASGCLPVGYHIACGLRVASGAARDAIPPVPAKAATIRCFIGRPLSSGLES